MLHNQLGWPEHHGPVTTVSCHTLRPPSLASTVRPPWKNKFGCLHAWCSSHPPAQCLQDKAPQYLSNYCVPVCEVSSRQQLRSASRHQRLLIPRYHVRTFGHWAFAASGPTFWNSLADELRTDSSDRFKLALKTFLFATYYHIQRIRGFCSDALYKLMIDSDVCLYVLPVNVVLFCKLCKPWYWCWAEGEITCCRRQSHALHNSFLTVAHCHGWSA